MEELGIGRPSTYASTLAVLRDRDYVRLEKKRLIPEDKGRLVTAFLESFFAKYVGYDFTADLEEKLDRVSNSEIDWKDVLRDFWTDFSGALDGTKDLRTSQALDSLNELLGPHIFPARADGGDPRQCPSCGKGRLSLKIGKFGAFIGCSNYPDCKFTRVLSPTGQNGVGAEGERPGVRALGSIRDRRTRSRCASAASATTCSRAKARSRSAARCPRASRPTTSRLSQALALLSLPREVARHPDERRADPGRRRALRILRAARQDLRQLGRNDDVLAIGANRAIDLIVAKESGAGRGRFGVGAGRARSAIIRRSAAPSRCGRAASAPMSITARSTRRCRREAIRFADARRGGGDARGQGLGRRRRPRARRSSRRRSDHVRATDASAPTSIGARSTRRSRSRPRPRKSRSTKRSR